MIGRIDFSLAAMEAPMPVEFYIPPDPWLARRQCSFGASEVATLLVATGRRPLNWLPHYLLPDTRTTNRTRGLPRVIAQKAGIIAPRARGYAAKRGTERERELLELWRELIAHGHAEEAEDVDPSTVTHASLIPKEFWPLVDRHQPQLAATLDGWARDQMFGDLVVLECKCSVYGYEDLPPYYAVQVQAQLAVVGADTGFLIEGTGWSAQWTSDDGPVRTYRVERNDALIAEIRETCDEAWSLVMKARNDVQSG